MIAVLVLTPTVAFCLTADAKELTPLHQIEQSLAATPPRMAFQPERVRLFRQLDAWAMAPDTVYHDMKAQTSNAEFHAFYLRRMNKALAEVERVGVLEGAAIWKMYSSGVLVKSPEGVFAVDVVEGPLKSIHKSPAELPQFVFQWTPAMRERYARLVDVHLVTHWHYDHASFALCLALARAGKIVVVPEQLARVWRPKFPADSLRVLAERVDHRVGPFTVQTLDGVQMMKLDANKQWVHGPHDAQNNFYWIRAGGVQLMHKGDHRGKPWYDWLSALKREGKGIDVFFSMCYWPRGMYDHLIREFAPVIIPVHEHELGHKPRGVSTLTSHYRSLGRRRLDKGGGTVLTWGERLVLGKLEP